MEKVGKNSGRLLLMRQGRVGGIRKQGPWKVVELGVKVNTKEADCRNTKKSNKNKV